MAWQAQSYQAGSMRQSEPLNVIWNGGVYVPPSTHLSPLLRPEAMRSLPLLHIATASLVSSSKNGDLN